MNGEFKQVVKASKVTYCNKLLPESLSYCNEDLDGNIDFTTFVGILLNDGSYENSMYFNYDINDLLVTFDNAIHHGVRKFYIEEYCTHILLDKIHDWKDYIDEVIIMTGRTYKDSSKYYFEGIDVDCVDILKEINEHGIDVIDRAWRNKDGVCVRCGYEEYLYRHNGLVMSEIGIGLMSSWYIV